ncbi:MAG: hypothetical protein JJ949_09710 [Roseicyclus sp.]|nr:hypothetical protein [Roseicyclus sp.]MBO6924133.1 hypothetical protein [Roseicyclus sp.]
MRIRAALCALALAGAPALAQTESTDAPFSGPDWLSDTITRPHANVATSAAPQTITVMPLGQVRLDAVGILPFSSTGLPPDLWADSAPETLARLLLSQPAEGLPAILGFTQQLALAELDPPRDAGTDAVLFLARLDLLLGRGALAPARALMERAGPSDPRVFRRWFDVSLLTGQADRACAAMRASPDIAPTFPARIFCLARSGDWPAAALSLGTGEALGYITTAEADLIARFLDPELFEGEPPLPVPAEITPLHYQMLISLGERPPSTGLPLAFAHADLADLAGWRAQLDAAERLMRAGAIEPEEWLVIYTARVPAASGGVWDRVAALQAFDAALLAGDPVAVTTRLPQVWAAMQQVGLEVPFARLYADRLLRLPLTGEAAMLARRVGLLSPLYEAVAQGAVPQDAYERRLFAIAGGEAPGTPPTGSDAVTAAVAVAFADVTPPERFTRLLTLGRTGEALLRAARTLGDGTGDVDDIADALRLFRALGLEDTARRAALQLLILDRT